MHTGRWLGAMLLAGVATVAAAQAPGDRVLARWSADGMWYPARVTSTVGGGVQVAYDDGDVAVVEVSDVRLVDWRVGSRLQCNWKNRGAYYSGTVGAKNGETITFRYDDGYTETMTISRCRSHSSVE